MRQREKMVESSVKHFDAKQKKEKIEQQKRRFAIAQLNKMSDFRRRREQTIEAYLQVKEKIWKAQEICVAALCVRIYKYIAKVYLKK